MNNRNLLYKILIIFIGLSTPFLFVSCRDKKEEPDPVPPAGPKTSILIYAVASNNLYYAFKEDLREIEAAARNIDLSQADIIIYSVTPRENPELQRIERKESGEVVFNTLHQFDRTEFSTDPKRMAEVMDLYLQYSDAPSRGLILWSHGTGWQPNFSDHIVPEMSYSFGADRYGDKTDYCDIIELADAIPSDTFNYIWFDCCYMASIEVLYQLRDKADYFAGSPMELAGEGNPYNLVLPYLARENYDLVKALDIESEYFKSKNTPFAFALVDSQVLPEIAVMCESAVIGDRPSPYSLQSYHRSPVKDLYDFRQYTLCQGNNLGELWDAEKFMTLMDHLVIYKSVSDKDWKNIPISKENYSGLSVYYFEDLLNDETEYYKKLDWFKDVYSTVPEF